MRKYGGEGESDKEFEGKIRKLVAKLPWEKKDALSTFEKKEKSQNLKRENEMKNCNLTK